MARCKAAFAKSRRAHHRRRWSRVLILEGCHIANCLAEGLAHPEVELSAAHLHGSLSASMQAFRQQALLRVSSCFACSQSSWLGKEGFSRLRPWPTESHCVFELIGQLAFQVPVFDRLQDVRHFSVRARGEELIH